MEKLNTLLSSLSCLQQYANSEQKVHLEAIKNTFSSIYSGILALKNEDFPHIFPEARDRFIEKCESTTKIIESINIEECLNKKVKIKAFLKILTYNLNVIKTSILFKYQTKLTDGINAQKSEQKRVKMKEELDSWAIPFNQRTQEIKAEQQAYKADLEYQHKLRKINSEIREVNRQLERAESESKERKQQLKSEAITIKKNLILERFKK